MVELVHRIAHWDTHKLNGAALVRVMHVLPTSCSYPPWSNCLPLPRVLASVPILILATTIAEIATHAHTGFGMARLDSQLIAEAFGLK